MVWERHIIKKTILVAGVDEVGRGCLAGPVVSAAVVLPSDFYDSRIKDSKKLSAKKREELFPFICSNAVSYGFGVVCPLIIDKTNILRAVKQAMHSALSKLTCDYDKLIVDAVGLNHIDKDFIHPAKADDTFIQVSSASIIAKVYRDRLMVNLSKIYPEFKWEKNAGYGTKEHIEAVKKYGITPVHRRSFLKNIVAEEYGRK